MARETVAIIGSRDWTDRAAVARAIAELEDSVVIITGCCPTGVDQMVYDHCQLLGRVCTRSFAPWKRRGNYAGPLRNEVIESLSDRVIAFDQGASHFRRRRGRPGGNHSETPNSSNRGKT